MRLGCSEARFSVIGFCRCQLFLYATYTAGGIKGFFALSQVDAAILKAILGMS